VRLDDIVHERIDLLKIDTQVGGDYVLNVLVQTLRSR